MNINLKPKIAVIHDAFLYRGGGERLVTLMAQGLHADLISGFFSEGSFIPEELGFTGKKIPLGSPVFAKGIRHLVLKHRFRRAKKLLQDYDRVILSGNCLDILDGFEKREKAPKIIYYCHTPPRYLFDLRPHYLAKIPKIVHPIVNRIFDAQAKEYQQLLNRVDVVLTNSKNTHDRLLAFCGRDSEIVYPPTDTTKFVPKTPETKPTDFSLRLARMIAKKRPTSDGTPPEYYLSFARLAPAKRVHLVVEAFLRLPEKNLVFTYGKNDPMKDEILSLAAQADNIFPIPAPSDADFISLVQGAVANIYIPIDEDFGMSPVEAMACGVPTIGVDE